MDSVTEMVSSLRTYHGVDRVDAQEFAMKASAAKIGNGQIWQLIGQFGKQYLPTILKVISEHLVGKSNEQIIADFPNNPIIVQIVNTLFSLKS